MSLIVGIIIGVGTTIVVLLALVALVVWLFCPADKASLCAQYETDECDDCICHGQMVGSCKYSA